MELSTNSKTMWCRPVPSSVSPMYMPGRLRTASSPFRTLILEELYFDSLINETPEGDTGQVQRKTVHAAYASLFFRQFSMFHVEHSVFRCITVAPEHVRFRMLDRGDKHLTTQILELMRQHDPMAHIQFGIDVVQQESHLLTKITQHLSLGNLHQNNQCLLLPPGKGFRNRPTT